MCLFFFFPFAGADPRSRDACVPWFVRSADIFFSAVASSAQAYWFGSLSLLTLFALAVGGHIAQVNLLYFVHLYEVVTILLTFLFFPL